MQDFKERPILFNTEMVKAVLDGRKTQTRRVMEYPKDFIWNNKHFKENYTFDKVFIDDIKNETVAIFKTLPSDSQGPFAEWFKCPYGQVGDRLWVRETWSLGTGDGKTTGINVQFKSPPWLLEVNNSHKQEAFDLAERIGFGAWRPSIHMFRWASRINLEITDIRVERVQDITCDDALAEGLRKWPHKNDYAYGFNGGAVDGYGSPTGAFRALWDSINNKRGFGWAVNPWVWVVEFKVL